MNSSSKKSLFTILFGALFFTVVLTSCENFLKSAEIKQEIEDVIAYKNAKEISVLIQPEEGTGSTVPAGNHKAKQGYDFEVSFTENHAYSFIKWVAVEKDNLAKEITSGVTFENATAPITKVKITNDTTNIRIIPKAEERIAVSGEPSPRYDTLGVSRDRSISVSFTKYLDPSSFIFAKNEIPAGAATKADENGNIWAYTLNGETILKNISITNIDDYSIADHFTRPQVDGKLLTIAVDKTNPIQFNSSEIFKTVKVTLSANITDTSNIKMNTIKSWNYQITETTDEKATVTLSSTAVEGSVYLAGTKDYSLGQKITLAFTEDANYQFVKWDYDPAIIYIEDFKSINTTAVVLEKSTATIIKAVCAPRLRVTSFAPVNDNQNPTVSKNSSIFIKFNQNLPTNEEDIEQLKNISISMGGTVVNTCFKSPEINGNTVTFVADNLNMLDVPAGMIKTVSVAIPSDFYYRLEDESNDAAGTKVSYGGNGIIFDYKIDDTTLDKAEITFSSPANSGSFTGASGTNHYSIGQEVTISFNPSSGWQFNGWNVISGGKTVPESQIKIVDKKSLFTKLIVYEAIQGVSVIADASEVLKISDKSPKALANPKDSDIIISFNKNLADDCKSLLNKININLDGINFDSYYADRSISNNKIIIKNTAPISVQKGNSKIISVTIPSDFYYIDGTNKIYFAGESFSFTIDYSTIAKAKVSYKIIDGETNQEFNSSTEVGTINQANYKEYYIGEEVPVSFAVNQDYQFYCWRLTDSSNTSLTNQINFKNSTSTDISPTFVMNVSGDYSIYVVCYKRPVISYSSISPYNTNDVTEFPKNTPIVLSFAHAIKPETKESIKISYSAISIFNKDTYFTTTISNDNKTITLTPKKMLPIEHAYEIVTVSVPCDSIYYLAADRETKITPQNNDFNWSYRVNSSTMTQSVVRVDSSSAKATYLTVNNSILSSGTNQILNIEQSMNIEYPLEAGYKFSGWKITTATSGYTVTPSGDVVSGTITVKNGSKTYFTLEIPDNTKPEKAIMTLYEAIGNGAEQYGLTVAAKDVLLPKIISMAPDYSTDGIECDSPIEIEFNKDINPSTVRFSSTGTIQIVNPSNEKEHYEKYFNNPVWNGNTLTIKPKSQDTYADNGNNNNDAIRRLFSRTNDLINLEVKIDYDQIKDISGNLLQKNDSLWVYRIKYAMETVAPEVNITLKKPIYKLEKYLLEDGTFDYRSIESEAFDSYRVLSEKQFDLFTPSIFSINHIGTKVYFTATASDSGSGYKGLTIKETMIRTVTGDTVKQECKPINYGSTRTEFTDEEYILQSKEDGVIQLDFIFEDYADNKTTKTYYVIRDTKIDSSTALKRQFTGYSTRTVLSDGSITSSLTSQDCYYQIPGQDIVGSFFDTQGTMTELFNFTSCTDKYYSQGSVNYNSGYNKESSIMYVLDYGYSMNEMLAQGQAGLISNNQGSYSIQRDVSKDFFVRITAMDDAGNLKNVIRVIPGKVNLSLMTKDNNYGYFHLENINTFDNNATEYGARNFDYTYVYTYQAAENAEPTEFRTKFYRALGDIGRVGGVHKGSDRIGLRNGNVDNEIFFPNGIYKFYVLPCYCYSELSYFGCFSEPYTYYHNYTPSNSSSTNEPAPAFPASYTFPSADIIHPINTGYTMVKAKLTDDSALSDGFVYGIKYKVKNSNKQYEYGGLEFVVPSGYIYDTALYAKNSNGTIFDSEQQNPVELDATYDNIPPDVDVTNTWTTIKSSSPDKIYLYRDSSYRTFPLDNNGGSGIYTNTDGKNEFNYYLIKKANKGASITDQITRADLLNYTKHTIAYSEARTYLWLDWDSFIEGNYILVLDLKDNNQNSALYSYVVVNATTPEMPETRVDTVNKILYVKALPSHNSYYGYINRLEGNEWSPSSRFEGQNMGNEGIVDRAYGFSFRDGHKDYFTRCSVNNGNSSDFIHSLYAYVCPGYDIKKAADESFECSSKAVIPGLGGAYQVYYDGPCFAHTMVFPTDRLDDLAAKLTEAKSIAQKNNQTIDEETYIKAIWETKGREYGLKLINSVWLDIASTATYTAPVSEIPSGYSYVTIFHFADGTSVMSEIKQK